ncbi:Galacturan 1,4-alpha-galacturonidase [Penicillium ucsense]|uniref:galacturonan 1,4-alpha-galacturonidase n=1 Tax=Penicillium ucsense TaxID=2839758 RepID=A0A8J8WIZ1_9EURO|nr:Galacturan 1,4-alpha-galacturonidase [Penicillium ucsense]KAF7739520.1 Galacturan 1,4-alpha-galacturonidase [Penicillium ucsense]
MLLSHVPVFALLFGLTFGSPKRPHRCVIPCSKDQTADDSQTVNRVFAQCAHDSVIIFEEGADYNIFKPISATNLSNVEIQVKGNLHLPQSIAQIQRIVNGTDRVPNTDGHTWFTFSGPQIDYVGSEDINSGWIYSYGQAWWDANPANGTGIASRPHLMSFQTTDGSMKYFKSRKPIAWNVKLKGDNIDISHAFIDAESDNESFPFNTDGFDVSATNVRVTDSVFYNGDDAIAVSDGSHNVVFKHNTIGFQSHGMSIGSLGSNPKSFNNVSDIHFEDVTVINAIYAARFKSWIGGQGLVKNVSWKNIRVYNVTFPIFVTQSYFNQGSTQTPRVNNASVVMENFTWEDFTGTLNTYHPGDGSCTSDPCWYDAGLPSLNHTESVIIQCNTASSCKDFKLKNIQVIPQSLAKPTAICVNATAELNPHLGVC